MEELRYIGEQLLPGKLGHFLVILGFVSALLSAIGYLKTTNLRTDAGYDKGWLAFSRTNFLIHTISVLAIIGLIFFIMINQMYEYRYAWEHVSEDLPMRYIFSAFWEGQEGSFLLWMFWHVVLGGIILLNKGKWEPPVMATIAFVEVIINSMIIGVYFTDAFKLGSSPFLLLRDTMDAPIFNNPDYLSMIQGNGLNPLLQNYWMTIHPPTLFLGFASVTIPFSFALAGLWMKEYKSWLKPVLPWALFSAGILGTGIVMGGAWAYEALNFGGYWAWDPVENMSLVPWLILLAGIHGNLIARSTGYSIKATLFFYLLSFVLIIYSTFLTRSGVLGDESVHAFTEMGLEWQLVLFILIFSALSTWMLARRWKQIPAPEKEEKLQTREFWMFIGTLILLFSAILITFTTSIPVYNKIFDGIGFLVGKDMSHLHRSMPVDPEPHFNRYQLWIAVFVAFLSSIAQVLRYGGRSWETYQRRLAGHLLISTIGGIALFILIRLWIDTFTWQNAVLLGAATFAVVSNVDYIVRFLRANWKSIGSPMAHLGFALMLIGVLASGTNKRTISRNEFAQASLLDDVDARNNIVLIQGKPMFMEGYWVTYRKDTIIGQTRKFLVDYKRVDPDGDTVEAFTLLPNVMYDKQFTKVSASNPDTKHYLGRDIFSYIHALPAAQMDAEEGRKQEENLDFHDYLIRPGDTLTLQTAAVVIDDLVMQVRDPEYDRRPGDLAFSVSVKARKPGQQEWHHAAPGLVARQALLYRFPAQVNDLNLRLELPDDGLNRVYTPEDSLAYQAFTLQQGETKEIDGIVYQLIQLDRIARHPDYIAEEEDVALNAIITVQNRNLPGIDTLRPLFFIRGNIPYHLKAYSPSRGIHLRFTNIDPVSETFYFEAAVDPDMNKPVTLRIAERVPRDDLIVMEVIEFPGINLFWLGTVMMMAGLFLSMYTRARKPIP